MAMMDGVLPIRTSEPRYSKPLPLDHSNLSLNVLNNDLVSPNTSKTLAISPRSAGTWPNFSELQNGPMLVYVLDLHDYSDGMTGKCDELAKRVDSCLLETASLANRGTPSDLPFVLALSNAKRARAQIITRPFTLRNGEDTKDDGLVVDELATRFRETLPVPMEVFVLEDMANLTTEMLLGILQATGLHDATTQEEPKVPEQPTKDISPAAPA